jgi:hypothetical protein
MGGIIRNSALFGLMAVVSIGSLGASQLRAADPRIGSWTLVSAESAIDPPNKLVIVSSRDEGVHVVMTGENHLDFTAKGNGHETAVTGNPAFDEVGLKRIDKKQAVVTEKKAGTVVATIREKVSADAKGLTITTTRTGHADQIAIWTRTGGAKVANDPASGEWAEDLSKSRMAQGLMVKIDADGSGALRFMGEFSYTARLDGKPYDLTGSRNDTVSLAQTDAHTVESTYRRDNQVTEKDKWTVSGDGQQMTLTTSGTLENGQRITEKLVFKKQ